MGSMARKHGFKLPLDPHQVGALIFFALLASGVYAFYVPCVEDTSVQIGLLVTYTVLVCVVMSLHVVTSLTDPSDPGVHDNTLPGIFYCALCQAGVGANSKHCRSCNRCVEGFDHHCKWLNNCIGCRNYRPFFFLVLSTVSLLVLQFAWGLWLLSRSFFDMDAMQVIVDDGYDAMNYRGWQAALFIYLALLVVAILMLGELTSFHIVLILRGMTTYEFIMATKELNASGRAMGIGSGGARDALCRSNRVEDEATAAAAAGRPRAAKVSLNPCSAMCTAHMEGEMRTWGQSGRAEDGRAAAVAAPAATAAAAVSTNSGSSNDGGNVREKLGDGIVAAAPSGGPIAEQNEAGLSPLGLHTHRHAARELHVCMLTSDSSARASTSTRSAVCLGVVQLSDHPRGDLPPLSLETSALCTTASLETTSMCTTASPAYSVHHIPHSLPSTPNPPKPARCTSSPTTHCPGHHIPRHLPRTATVLQPSAAAVAPPPAHCSTHPTSQTLPTAQPSISTALPSQPQPFAQPSSSTPVPMHHSKHRSMRPPSVSQIFSSSTGISYFGKLQSYNRCPASIYRPHAVDTAGAGAGAGASTSTQSTATGTGTPYWHAAAPPPLCSRAKHQTGGSSSIDADADAGVVPCFHAYCTSLHGGSALHGVSQLAAGSDDDDNSCDAELQKKIPSHCSSSHGGSASQGAPPPSGLGTMNMACE